MAGGKGKSSGGKSSGGKTSANDGPKKQQSHSARAGLQVSCLSFFVLFFLLLVALRYLAVRRADDRAPLDRPTFVRQDPPNNKRVAADTDDSLPVRLDAATFILDNLSDGSTPPQPPLIRRNDHRIGSAQRVPTHHPAFAIAHRQGHCYGRCLEMPGLRRGTSRQQTALISRCTC